MSCLRTQRSASGKARNRNPSIKIHDWQCTPLNVAVSYPHIYGKSKHTYTIFFPHQRTQYRRAGYQRWSGRARFCHNHRRSDNQKTEVGEASDKILNIWTHAIFFNLPHRRQTNAQMSLRISMRRQMFKQTKNKTSIM